MSKRSQKCGRGLCVSAALVFFVRAEPLAQSFGEVRLDATNRVVSFSATVNMREGPVEYLVVHETGKIHESILKTTASAKDMHVAALLLAEGAEKPELRVETISVSWVGEGKTNRVNVGEWIIDKKIGRPRKGIAWTYRGSRVVNSVFLAERDGSVLAIMEDRDALIDQAAPDASDDENWEPNGKAMPAIGAAVTVEMKFAKAAAAK